MRFSTLSPAVTTSIVNAAGILQINGFAVTGGGASYQFDALPTAFGGGSCNNVVGITSVKFTEGLREIGKGPFLRLAGGCPVGNFWFKFLDDDAPNAANGNGWVDNASGSSVSTFSFESIGSSVGGQVGVAGPGFVTAGPSAGYSGSASGTTSSAFSYVSSYGGSRQLISARGAAIRSAAGRADVPSGYRAAYMCCP